MKKDVKLMLLNNFGHRCPKWLTDPREKEMTLSRDATESEVDLFLIELLSVISKEKQPKIIPSLLVKFESK